MTMLDRMRRHKNWLKWSLAIVVVAFVALYIPSFLENPRSWRQPVRRGRDGRGPGHHRRPVPPRLPAADAGVSQRLRRQHGRAHARQLGIEQRDRAAAHRRGSGAGRSRRQGITASDAEVRARILALPAFQENGQLHRQRPLRQILQMQNPPINPARVRGRSPAQHHRREAPGRADRLDHRRRQRRRPTSSTAATRRSSSRSWRFPPTSSRTAWP